MITPTDQIRQRSQTNPIDLPNIKKLSYSHQNQLKDTSSRYAQKSKSFMAKLKEISPQNDQYQYMDSSLISQQTNKLKGMLRQFNQQTYDIIKTYMHRCRNAIPKQRGSSTSAIDIKKKQIENNNHLIEICQNQIKCMQRKCENLKYLSVEDFQKKINNITKQIEQIRNQNKEIAKSNILRGLNMAKQKNKINQIIHLDKDKNILLNKKARLQDQTNHVKQQTEMIKEKQAQLSKQFQEIQVLYQTAVKKQQERQQNNRKMEDIKQKQKLKSTTKTKNHAIDSKNQQIYFQTLRELQEKVKEVKKVDEDIQKTSDQLINSKRQMETLSKQLTLLKNSLMNQSITLLKKGNK